ncbi:trihelix transcription factor ASR3-like [Quillaja saponaria]|uniref:Trihelix transcription factor ASR3-like n=1 Tax=Quillaja saponaria TaxID=32244 RepID=A0AAD7KTA8_QUISA|nr:trihelix transcription factor ASR3-like [Quillaja saponaria]
MGPEAEEKGENVNISLSIGIEKEQKQVDNSDDKAKTRHPRWTREETFILIQAKKVVETGGQRVRRYASPSGILDQLEPKWDSISSLCKKQGVNREPVQCRKRWSNLVGEFNKIKKWESDVKEEGESFWMMRNEKRKENKLPGFFDQEVYNVLDGKVYTGAPFPLQAITTPSKTKNSEQAEATEQEEDDEEEPEAVFDNGQYATAEDGLFSEFENCGAEETGRSPAKEINVSKNPTKEATTPVSIAGTKETNMTERMLPDSDFLNQPVSQDGRKRMRVSLDDHEGNINFEDQLLKVLKRNSDTLEAHLGSRNTNFQLERDQRKEQTDILVSAMNKLTDALVRIADKM